MRCDAFFARISLKSLFSMVLFVRYFFHVPFSFTPLKLRYTVILFLCWFFFLSHLSRSTFYSTFSFWFQSGHKWRSHRKLIAPTFHLNVLKGFIDLFNENSRQVIKKLDLELGKTFDAHDHMSEATVEILLGKKITLHILLLLCFFHSIVHSFIQHTIFCCSFIKFATNMEWSRQYESLPSDYLERILSPAVMHNGIPFQRLSS